MKRRTVRIARLLCLGTLFAAGLLLAGCSSIKVVESWNSPARQAHRFSKVMILGIGHDESLRGMAENIIVYELRRNGVEAVASHTLLKEIDAAKYDDVVAAVRKAGTDGVLSIRPTSKGITNITQDGQTGGIYGTVTNVGGSVLPGARDYSLATLQVNLYDAASAALVWTSTITTNDAGNAARVSRDLAAYFLKELRKDGFL